MDQQTRNYNFHGKRLPNSKLQTLYKSQNWSDMAGTIRGTPSWENIFPTRMSKRALKE
jgi:hypothetical protein